MKTFEMPIERLMMYENSERLRKYMEKSLKYNCLNTMKSVNYGEKVKKRIRKK